MRNVLSAASIVLAVALASPLRAEPPASQPDYQAAVAALKAKRIEMLAAMDANKTAIAETAPNSVLIDAEKRDAVREKMIALLNERSRLMTEYQRYTPRPPDANEIKRVEVMLYLFNDAPTVARVNGMNEGDAAMQAEGIRLESRWLAAGGMEDKQKVVAADADRIAAEHPASTVLTTRIVSLVKSAATEEIRQSLLKTTTQTMNNAVSKQIVAEVEQTKAHVSMQAAAERQKAFVGKPMVVSGPTVDGGTFSTADLKGKVVMIDFWATWCGPCKAELPHVKALVKEYGDKGFAVVGVSGDESAKPLQSFVKSQDIPWPQLFDAAAAERGEQPIFKQFGIAALPTVFVIDKNGICRSVTGRNKLDTLIPKLLAE